MAIALNLTLTLACPTFKNAWEDSNEQYFNHFDHPVCNVHDVGLPQLQGVTCIDLDLNLTMTDLEPRPWPSSTVQAEAYEGDSDYGHTDKKKFRWDRSVAKSQMRKGFLIYEEIRKYLVIYEEAVRYI